MSRKILWNRKKELKNFPVCIVWRKRLKVAEDYKEIKNYRLKNIRKVFKFYFDNMLSNKRDPKKEETSFSYEGSERWKNLKMNLTQLIFSFTVKWTQYKEEKNKRCHSPIQGRQTQHCHLSCCYCLCDQRYRESSPKSEEWDTKGKVVWNSQIPSRKVQRYFYLNLSILIDLPPPPAPFLMFQVNLTSCYKRIAYRLRQLKILWSFNLKYSLPYLIQVPVQKKCVFLF